MFKSCCVCISKKVDLENQSPQRNKAEVTNSAVESSKHSDDEAVLTNGCCDSRNGVNALKISNNALQTVFEESHTNSYCSEEQQVSSLEVDSTKMDPTSETTTTQNEETPVTSNVTTESSSKIKFGGSIVIEDGATIPDSDDEGEDSDTDSENVIDKLTGAYNIPADTGDTDQNKEDPSESESMSDQVFEKPTPVPMRKSSTGGILKRPSVVDKSACEEVTRQLSSVRLDIDDEVFPSGIDCQRLMARKRSLPAGALGVALGRDELALKRHRIFSELVGAAKAAVEHKVRFDPLELAIPAPEKSTTKVDTNSLELEKLLKRLETVVNRLEKVADCIQTPGSPAAPSPQDSANTEESLPSTPQHNNTTPPTMSLGAYNEILSGPLERFIQCSAGIQHVEEQAAVVKKLFQTQFDYLMMTTRSRPPTNQNETVAQLKGHTEGIEAVQKLRESNKSSPNFTFLSAISESIPALGWVCVKPAPAPYIKEMNDVGKYYTNRILKESKGNQQYTNWCVAWTETLSSLEAFVKQYHTTGLVWGGGAADVAVCPIPPPPCPPPSMPPPPDMSAADANDDRSALFAQINQGEDITKNLKKVTADMQTHKNPTLREGPAPFKTPVGAPKPFSKNLPTPGAGQVPVKPPVFNRDGKKWLIEYQVGNSNLIVENAEMNNVVYIFRCRDSCVQVKGKINSVVMDSCTKCSVVFESLVSSVEFVNCQSVQMQVIGKVPTISIDKTDGCQMYLSPDSMDVEIISSKSSEMNVLIPKGNGDYTELPVAEQFKTIINRATKSLNTVAVESKG